MVIKTKNSGKSAGSKLVTTFSIFIVCLVSSASVSASGRFEFTAKEVGFRPVSNWQFLRAQEKTIEAPICEYAKKIDDPCMVDVHPPCEKLVPIALNFCAGDIVRAMQPRVLSKAESIFWKRKYTHCVYESTRALVTNPLRREEYCRAPKKED